MSSQRRAPSLLESFNFAFEGIIHVLRTQRNMRIHFLVAAVVLIVAFAVGVSRLELIALLLAIAFVLIAEMINTAVELARRVLANEGVEDGELGLVFVDADEGRRLKREHLGVD